ncbi:hypothetical protein [Hwanghaeella sp.]|uniref:hypothetical protein n=1 Tax=Hwanghaeella sp. TaxID=2605943 RepID=UPI003CCBC992
MKNKILGVAFSGILVCMSATSALANEFEAQILDILNNQVRTWLSDPAIVDAVKAQNTEHANLGDADIDALDKKWRAEAEAGGGELINRVLGKDISKFLTGKKEGSNGIFSEIFVMDNKGLNVGQSDVTSDYMQGDEGKWQKTYQAGPDAVFVDEVEFDDSSQTFQSQVSATVVDPTDGKPIGAITLGINVENL